MADMEEELHKRNTDCVYFLASPLTCKKGMECEYRHSEKARLNPRDCWYWLSGTCLNPTCAFRHPPLDGPSPKAGESATPKFQNVRLTVYSSQPLDGPSPNAAESAAPKYHGSTTATGNKSDTPCHFYFSGFCNKGVRCPFSHGPDGSSTAVKPLKPEALPSENKSSTGSETGSVPKLLNNNPPANAKKPIMHKNIDIKEEFQTPALRSKPQKIISPRVSDSEFEEAARVKSVPLVREEGIIQSRSNVYTDQSSEEQSDDHVEPEERLESSPGFDVLVNNKMENSDYEDHSEFLVGMDGEHGEHFMGYDQDVYDAYDHLDGEHGFDNGVRPSGHSRERRPDSVFSQKRRRVSQDELPIDVRGGMDLRERLRERGGIDERPTNRLSRQHESSRLNGRIQRRPQRLGVPISQRLQGRLASRVEIEPLGDNNGIFSNGSEHHGWHRGVDSNSHRQQHYREKRVDWHSGSGEVSRKRRSSPEGDYSFSGPKSLAQIREEKKRAEENGGYTPVGFEGPKPLSEILKDKRMD